MGQLHTKTMNRLQAAVLEHTFVIQYKKVPPCQQIIFQSCHPAIQTHLLKSPNALNLSNQTFWNNKKPMLTYRKWIIFASKLNGQQMCHRQMPINYNIWPQNCIKMQTRLSGFIWMTTNTPEQHCSYLKNFKKWHFVKLKITNLEATMQLSKPTFI